MGNRKNRFVTPLLVEKLEDRYLLAYVPFELPSEPPPERVNITPEQFAEAQQWAAFKLRDVPSGLQGKFTFGTWDALQEIQALVADHQAHPQEGIPLSQVELLSPYAHDASLNDDGEVLLQFKLNAWNDSILQKLQENGLHIESTTPEYREVTGWIHGLQLQPVGQLSEVEYISLPIRCVFLNISTEGDAVHNADDVRSPFSFAGVDGSGIKIGVISDGVDNRTAVGGELPTITVNGSLPGSGDEGTAMLEILSKQFMTAIRSTATSQKDLEFRTESAEGQAAGLFLFGEDAAELGDDIFLDRWNLRIDS